MCSAAAEVLWRNIKAASSDLLDLQAWISRENLNLHFLLCLHKEISSAFLSNLPFSVCFLCQKHFQSSGANKNIFFPSYMTVIVKAFCWRSLSLKHECWFILVWKLHFVEFSRSFGKTLIALVQTWIIYNERKISFIPTSKFSQNKGKLTAFWQQIFVNQKKISFIWTKFAYNGDNFNGLLVFKFGQISFHQKV